MVCGVLCALVLVSPAVSDVMDGEAVLSSQS